MTPAAHPSKSSRPGNMRHRLALAFLAAGFLLSPLLAARLNPNAYQGGRTQDERELLLRNTSAIAAVLGEIRASMSDMMFIKTERYLHSGVAYTPHIDLARLASKGETARKERQAGGDAPTTLEHTFAFEATLQEDDPDHEHGEAGHVHDESCDHTDPDRYEVCKHEETLIPHANKDFRGFIGRLEREVKPYNPPGAPHFHTDGTELLPWYRLQTLSDPHNVRAYMIGAWWLKNLGGEQVDEALRFVEEGIRFNPRAYQLHLMRGNLLRMKNENNEARLCFRTAAEEGLKQRPAEGAGDGTNPRWTYYNEQDLLSALRLAVIFEKVYGDRAEALRLARDYTRRLGDPAPLARQIRYLTGQEPDPMDLPPAPE